jgi:PST family polysaccharide transporter
MNNRSMFSTLWQKRSFLIDASQVFLNRGLNAIVPVLLLPYYTHVFGIEQYGMLVYVQSGMLLLQLISDYGFTITATRDASANESNPKQLGELVGTVYSLKAILIAGCYGIILALAWWGDWTVDHMLFYLAVFTAFAVQSLLPFWLFQGMKRNVMATGVNLIAKVFLVILVLGWMSKDSELILVPVVEGLSYLLGLLLSLLIISQVLHIRFALPSWSRIIGQFNEGKYYFIYSVLNWTVVSGAVMVVEEMSSAVELGYYATFSRLGYYAFAVLQPISLALFPYYASRSEASSMAHSGFKYFAMLIAIFLAVSLLLVVSFFRLFYGESFLQGVQEYLPVMYLILIWVSMVSLNYFMGLQFLIAARRDRLHAILYAVNTAIAVAGYLLLIPRIGLVGAPMAMLAGEIVYFVLLFTRLRSGNHRAPTVGSDSPTAA